MKPISIEVVNEVLAEQRRMGWPEMVPQYVELRDPNGRCRYMLHGDLTIATAEQASAGHQLAAARAMRRWERTRSPRWARRAAYHIVRARLYRCSYLSKIGKTDSTEDDMPFAHNQW